MHYLLVLEKRVREINASEGIELGQVKIGLIAYADDIALLGDNIEMIKSLGKKLIKAAENVGLTLNDDKTEYLIVSRKLLNAELQRVTLSFQEAQNKIKNIRASVQEQRNSGFNILWNDSKLKSNKLCLEEKDKTRIRKLPKQFTDGSESHIYSDIQEEYKALFYGLLM
ncbi:hypothetical protein ACI65C_006130 [Semiaphis heraclei]